MPEYTISAKPDYLAVGHKVDIHIEKHLGDGDYLIRAISSEDHLQISRKELVDIILRQGTDKYDPGRKEVEHHAFTGYDHDIQAARFEIRGGKIIPEERWHIPSVFGDIVYNFYKNAPKDRGKRVRIDILMIYYADKLEHAVKVDQDAPDVAERYREYLYRFKEPDRKPEALAGVMVIK